MAPTKQSLSPWQHFSRLTDSTTDRQAVVAALGWTELNCAGLVWSGRVQGKDESPARATKIHLILNQLLQLFIRQQCE